MKRLSIFLLFIFVFQITTGCSTHAPSADIAATTLPVYQFTCMLTQGTDLTVERLVTENVSCLHDYSLNVRQVKTLENADTVVISGAGLEDFMQDLLQGRQIIDASVDISLLEGCHQHGDAHEHTHNHEADSHIWLSPALAMVMAENICLGLQAQYPQHAPQMERNLAQLLHQLQALLVYGNQQLQQLQCRELVTFHDGFAYLAQCFDLHILSAVEEEAGSETSSKKLIELIHLVNTHQLPAIFTETNGSNASAGVIAAETGAKLFTLDMAMTGDDYFTAMYHNIDILKEALG